MIYLKYDLNDEKVKYLIQSDENLGKLIKYIGSSELAIEEDSFKCLVKYIIGQQISDKARETIWKKVCSNIENIAPNDILGMSDEGLYKAGIPRHKVKYIKALAHEIVRKRIDFGTLQTLSNEKIISQLTLVKGIGRWTAEMYLIFSLKRENIFSESDGTLKRVIQWMYNLNEIPSTGVIKEYFSNWMEYATIVSSYLWKSIELGLICKPFEQVISGKQGDVDNVR